MVTVRLTITLDVPENTIAKAIEALLDWPNNHAGADNMVYRITHGTDDGPDEDARKREYAYRESVGEAFRSAILHSRPEVAKDFARLEELSPYWFRHWGPLGGTGFTGMTKDEVEPLREYVALQLKHQTEQKRKDGWGQRLKEINEAAEALELVQV